MMLFVLILLAFPCILADLFHSSFMAKDIDS